MQSYVQTRLLVTHGITFLPQADQIITMKDGHISEMGTYAELLQRNGAFADYMRTYLNEDEGFDDEDPEGNLIKTLTFYINTTYLGEIFDDEDPEGNLIDIAIFHKYYLFRWSIWDVIK